MIPTQFKALTASLLLALATGVSAADFTIVDGQTVTTTQTLNANETGIIEQGGQLNTTGVRGIDSTADNVTVSNSGKNQKGRYRLK